jgi:hypothetical protein
MNPATELHSVKSADVDDPDSYDAMRREARDHFSALLTDASEATAPAESLESQLNRAETRRLRRECDRIRLRESLGWDDDLIKELGL